MKINRKLFSSYFNHLSVQEKHMFEKESLKDPFLSDALDGFAENPEALQSLDKLDKRYYRGRNRIWKISGIFALSFIGLIAYLYAPTKHVVKTKIQRAPISIELYRITTKKLETLVVLPKEKELLPHKIQQEFKAKDKGMIFRANENPIFPTEEIVQLPMQSLSKVDRHPANKRSYFAMETYVNDLKVLDYRYYRKKGRQEKTDLLTGTPAAQENQGAGANQKDFLDISYMNFLSGTLSDFNRGEYKAALIGFDQILTSYPDDVNALFYSALCLYNLKQFNLCEQRLKVMDLAKFDNFDEEQHWYLLLCYKAQGEIQNFSDLKQEIIRANRFYASKAASINL
jgi:hypothetical protein